MRAAGLLILLASVVWADEVRTARGLLESNNLSRKLRGIDILVRADSGRAIDALEDVIKKSSREIERLNAKLERLEREHYGFLPKLRSLIKKYDRGFNMDREAKRLLARIDRVKAEMKPLSGKLRNHLRVVERAGEVFVKFRDEDAVRKIEQGARREPNATVRLFYIAGLRHESRRKSAPILLELLDQKDPRFRSAAVRSLIPMADVPGVVERVKPLAEDENWAVRLGAYQVVAGAPFAEAVEFLAKAAVRESGEIAVAIDSYLEALTGQSYAQQLNHWNVWWKKHAATVRSGGVPAPEKKKETGETKSVASFFRIPIVSDRIVFVIDFSGSMESRFKVRDQGILQRMRKYKLPATRLGYAQAEFIRAITAMPDGALFNVVGYNTRVRKWKSDLVELNRSSRASAIRWVRKLETEKLTNIYEGLEAVYNDYLGSSSGFRFKDIPDTVLFLSDGIATIGRFQETSDLGALVRIWNMPLDVVFHTVGIGKEHDRVLLKRLAKDTGGLYVDVKAGLRNLEPARRKMPEGLARHVKQKEERRQKVAVLVRQFRDGYDDERTSAARALAAFGADALPAAGWLIEALDAASANVRVAARDALVAIGAPAVPHLIRALESSDDDAVMNAADALARIGPTAKEAIPALEKALDRVAASDAMAAVEKAIAALR